MKTLIIPSWYSTPGRPLHGCYFKEQAQLLNRIEELDIRILYGDKKSSYLIVWIWLYIQSWIGQKCPISKELIEQNPPAFGFRFPANRHIPDFIQIDLEKRLVWKAYQGLTRTGWEADLIHAQSGMDAGIYSHHISKLTGIPFVIMEHQVFVFHYYSRLRATLIMNAFKAASKTAAVSFDERRQVMMNQPECNPEVIWNLVDESRYQIDLAKRNKEFTVITILNSLPIKGGLDFLDAIALVTLQDPSIRFVLIGKGGDEKAVDPSENLFIQKSKELGILDYGEFLPFVARERISEVLNQGHVFVSPTIQEPHGIAVREAMMCGLPFVSTANGGVEDSINAQTGLVVPVRDAVAMADAILHLKENYQSYNPEDIRAVAVAQCGRRSFLDSMLKFYQV